MLICQCQHISLCRRRKLLRLVQRLQGCAEKESGLDLALVGTKYTFVLAVLPTVLFLYLTYTSGEVVPSDAHDLSQTSHFTDV